MIGASQKIKEKRRLLKEIDDANSLLVYQLGDCLMDILDDNNIFFTNSGKGGYWQYLFNSSHPAFPERKMGILINNIRNYDLVSGQIGNIRGNIQSFLGRKIRTDRRWVLDISYLLISIESSI